MQRKKLATKIASILLSAAMLVSTTMTAFATDGEVSVAAEQMEVQTVAETAEEASLEVSEEDAAAVDETTEEEIVAAEETAAGEETAADEDIIEEITSEEAQENVEEAQVLDAEEVTADENEIAVADENISTVAETWTTMTTNPNIEYCYDSSNYTLYFQLTEAGKSAEASARALPNVEKSGGTEWAQTLGDTTQQIKDVIIDDGITGIGEFNFENASGKYKALTKVTLSSSVTTIGKGAFMKSAVTTINLDNVTNVGMYAFQESSLTAAALGKDVTIGSEAFYLCTSLNEVYAAGNVTLNKSCFNSCTKLQKFTCNGTVKEIPEAAFYNCNTLATVTANGVETVGQSAFYGCAALASFDFSKVTNIAGSAFRTSGIKKVTLDATTVNIGADAFNNCKNLTDVTVKGNLTLDREVFRGCESLKTVTVEGDLTLGEQSFCQCSSMTSFKCNGTVKKIPRGTFSDCGKLESCDVKGVETLEAFAFNYCAALTSFDFSDVTVVGGSAIYESGITNIAFGSKDLTLDPNAFTTTDSGTSTLTKICYPGTMDEWKAIVEAQGVAVPGTTTIHSQADTKPVAATCTEYGWEKVGVCDSCGKDYTDKTNDKNKIDALGHAYSTSYTVDKKATCTEEGSESHHCTRCNAIEPGSERVIPKTGHTWSWTTQSKATVFNAEVQKGVCTVCKATETRTVGKKLTPTITVNASKIWLQKGQKTSAFKVSGLANGDSVKSYKSGNKKIFTVTNKGVIKAGKKVGKAKLTITLASGMKKVVTIQVQKRQVKTWHIYNLPANVTIKKGATYTLSPVISLITSTHKVTYKTSNKKVATVTSTGKIKGVKKGTATITVKSGTVTKKVKVTVK